MLQKFYKGTRYSGYVNIKLDSLRKASVLALLILVSACTPPATSITVSINPSGPQTLLIGNTLQLSAIVSNTSNTAVTWISSNNAVADVNQSGLVSAKTIGSATITARSVADTSKTASVSVGVVSAGSSISGTVSVPLAGGSLSAPFVPGELIVKFKPGVSVQSVGSLLVAGIALQQERPLSNDTFLYRTAASREQTLSALQALQTRSDIEYAQPNYLVQPQVTPNDPSFFQQWNLTKINMPQAWDIIRTPASPVTVAVIDSGVAGGHPDLAGNLVDGYNFISGERGPSPEDTDTGSNFHGTHVSGIIGAVTNNNMGIAGVAWGAAKIVPIRAISSTSGTIADIIDALRWSAGIAVSGVPANLNPASIINMSLGGPFPCSDAPALQSAINDALGKGAIITVAAGNGNPTGTPVDASTFSPAGCSGVITVGAINTSGNRASYSNYGTRIDLMAPGGEPSPSTSGILSTIKDSGGNFAYGYLAGTSQAAPHVAGVLALMKSLSPGLTAAQALSILKSTAVALTAGQCSRPSASDCGAGLIDANAALGVLNAPPPRSLTLSATPNALTLNPGGSANVTINIARTNFTGNVNLSVSGIPANVTVTPTSTSSSANSVSLSVQVGSSAAAGNYALTISGNDGGSTTANTQVTLTITQSAPKPSDTVKGAKVFFDAVISVGPPPTIQPDLSGITINQDGTSAPYVRSGLSSSVVGYRISAWKDIDGDGKQNVGDLFAWYMVNGQIATVPVGSNNINIQMQPIVSTTYTRDQMLREIEQNGRPSR